jgi:hypothetical protein
VHQANTAMARIVADRLVAHLERSGFVVMKRDGGVAPTTSGSRLLKAIATHRSFTQCPIRPACVVSEAVFNATIVRRFLT